MAFQLKKLVAIALMLFVVVNVNAEVYDYIVVGAGTSGCIVAARLSEDLNKRVLLLSTGDDQTQSPITQIPYVYGAAPYQFQFADYYYAYESAPNVNNQVLLRSHLLGGATLLSDGMLQPLSNISLARLSALSPSGLWNVAHMNQLWQRVETYQPNGSGHQRAGHGTSGPIKTIAVTPDTFLGGVMNATMQATNSSFNYDFGLGNAWGTGYTIRNMKLNSAGVYVRSDTWNEYIVPNLGRPNLDVIRGAEVMNVGRAPGCLGPAGTVCINRVTYVSRGKSHDVTVRYGGEVILAAGVFETPKILMHSGIGDCSVLAQFDIDCVRNLPTVGKQMHSHYQNFFAFGAFANSPDWTNGHQGAMITSLLSLGRTDGAINIDISTGGFPSPYGFGWYFPVVYTYGASKTNGTAQLLLSDWSADLTLTTNIFADGADLAPMIAAVRAVRNSFTQWGANSGVGYAEFFPGLGKMDNTDAGITSYLQQNSVASHQTGTTPLGLDGASAVVDEHLKVFGVSGLRVADAGVLPFAPETYASMSAPLLIGEQAAYLIRGC